MDEAIWTVPASRMKAGREFAVPLSMGALGLSQASWTPPCQIRTLPVAEHQFRQWIPRAVTTP